MLLKADFGRELLLVFTAGNWSGSSRQSREFWAGMGMGSPDKYPWLWAASLARSWSWPRSDSRGETVAGAMNHNKTDYSCRTDQALDEEENVQ